MRRARTIDNHSTAVTERLYTTDEFEIRSVQNKNGERTNKPLCADNVLENINIYLYYISFIRIKSTWVKRSVNRIQSISWMLMTSGPVYLRCTTLIPLIHYKGMEKSFHPTLYWAYDYLSMLGSKLIRVGKRGPWWVKEQRSPGIFWF